MPILYVISNPWYRNDSIYKVGKHYSDDIQNLLNQYPPRYLPQKELIRHWIVEDCNTMETILHEKLRTSGYIQQVEGEWYKGNVNEIIQLIEQVMSYCVKDEFQIEIDEEGTKKVYPLSYLSNEKLIQLGRKIGVKNPFRDISPHWRKMQILLIYFQDEIVDVIHNASPSKDRTVYLLHNNSGLNNDEYLYAKLYPFVFPILTQQSTNQLSQVIYGENLNQSQLQYRISLEAQGNRKDYNSMTIQEMKDFLTLRGIQVPSKISRKEDYINFLGQNIFR